MFFFLYRRIHIRHSKTKTRFYIIVKHPWIHFINILLLFFLDDVSILLKPNIQHLMFYFIYRILILKTGLIPSVYVQCEKNWGCDLFLLSHRVQNQTKGSVFIFNIYLLEKRIFSLFLSWKGKKSNKI